MGSHASKIIKALYGAEAQGRRPASLARGSPATLSREESLVQAYRERVVLRAAFRLSMLAALMVAGFLFVSSAYYFNEFTRCRQNITMETAIIDSISQRRRHLSINLARSVYDYAKHEQGILRHVADSRSALLQDGPTVKNPQEDAEGAPAPRRDAIDKVLKALEGSSKGGGPAFEAKLGKLLGVAESYPDLKLSENFRLFMTALISTEKDLNDEIIKFSLEVNRYTTLCKTIPGRWFAMAFGFGDIEYYPIDADAKRFHPIEY